jgi:uncharacterized membrane protein
MSKNNFEIRAIARESLKGSWTPVVLATFIFLILFCGVGSIPFIIFLFSLPISMSYTILFLKFLRGDKENAISNLFTCFNNYGKYLETSLLVFLYTFLWSLLFIIPGIIKSYAYSMTFYIVHDNPDINTNDAIELSMKMMKGNKGKLFLLDLSFIGWFLLCLLTLGIGMLWLYPYCMTARATFYEDLKANYTATVQNPEVI